MSGNEKFTYLFKPKLLTNFNPILFFDKEDIEKINEKKNNGQNIKFQLTDKGIYSISKPDDANWIIDCMKKSIGDLSKFTITDSTAGLGGNTISFAKHFKKVNAVEINSIHFFVLQNNIQILDFENVTMINDNYLNKISDLEEDIVFIDPPWGGKKYHYIKYFNIRLGKIPISKVINILHSKSVKYVVLKCPYNINVTDLMRSVDYESCTIYKSSHIWLIIFYGA